MFLYIHLSLFTNEMEPKLTCHLCQEETDHITSKCPNMKCAQCGQSGHAKKDCSSTSPPPESSMKRKLSIEPQCSTSDTKVIFDTKSVKQNYTKFRRKNDNIDNTNSSVETK